MLPFATIHAETLLSSFFVKRIHTGTIANVMIGIGAL